MLFERIPDWIDWRAPLKGFSLELDGLRSRVNACFTRGEQRRLQKSSSNKALIGLSKIPRHLDSA